MTTTVYDKTGQTQCPDLCTTENTHVTYRVPVKGTRVHWKQLVVVSSIDEWTGVMLLLLVSPPEDNTSQNEIIKIIMHIMCKGVT